MTDQIIYVKDPPPLLREKFLSDSAALENLSSRLNSIRNTSIDVSSILSDGENKNNSRVEWDCQGHKFHHPALTVTPDKMCYIFRFFSIQATQHDYLEIKSLIRGCFF